MKQYYHQKEKFDGYYHPHEFYPRYTVSSEMPEKIQLTNLIQPESDKLLIIYAGFTICNPKDRFIKAEGRKVADSRLKAITFKPTSLEYDELYNATIKMVPISPEEQRIKELTFKVFSGKTRVHLIQAKVK